jgi:biopolymer transport protein ExbD
MRLLNDQKKSRALLNITPLIDVLFILIIFFAVSSTFLEKPGIKLTLPEAQKTDLQKVEKAIIYVSSDEKIQFRDKEISLNNLEVLLVDAMKQSPDKSLIIDADENVPHGFVVKIMDIARQSGVQKLVIGAEKK